MSQSDYDVVIVGGGPIGLAAAIEARLNGAATVLVLERRARSVRPYRSILLDDVVMADFERHGVLTCDPTVFRHIDQFTAAIDSAKRNSTFSILPRPSRSEERTRRPRRTRDVFFRRSPRHTALLADIESGYLRAAQARGIEVRFNVRVVEIGGQNDGHPWLECATEPGVSRSGRLDETERIAARVLGIADGAQSDAMKQLGIGRIALGQPNQRLLVARFARSISDVPRGRGFTFRQVPTAAGGQLFLACLDEVETSLIVNVPPGQPLDSDDDRVMCAEEAAKTLGIHGRLDRHSISVCRHTAGISRRMTVGTSTFVMGDAACAASPYTGLGLNVGIRDAVRFGTVVRRQLGARNPMQFAWARLRYSCNTWISVALLAALTALMLRLTQLPNWSSRTERSSTPSRVAMWVPCLNTALFLSFVRTAIRCERTTPSSVLRSNRRVSSPGPSVSATFGGGQRSADSVESQ